MLNVRTILFYAACACLAALDEHKKREEAKREKLRRANAKLAAAHVGATSPRALARAQVRWRALCCARSTPTTTEVSARPSSCGTHANSLARYSAAIPSRFVRTTAATTTAAAAAAEGVRA